MIAKLLTIGYAPSFIRQYDKLEKALQTEVKAKIALFRDPKNHKQLEVHKLHGRMKDRQSFSVNYKDRVVFQYEGKNIALLKAVGDHEIYR